MTDPDVKHKDYTEYLPVWKKCRDAYQGQRAVRSAGKTYLPMLSGQTTLEYDKYILRANYFNATGRTVETMTGMLFRKDMKVEFPQSLKVEWLNDITLTEETLQYFAESCFIEMLVVGRAGILVDMPPAAYIVTVANT